MDENFTEDKFNDKWLDVGTMFESAANQVDDDLQLTAVWRNQEIIAGGIGDLSPHNNIDVMEDNDINTWQKFQNPQIKDDLASVFQNEHELQDGAGGLNEWMVTPEGPGERDRPEFEVIDNRTNEDVFSAISFSLKPFSKKQILHGRIMANLRKWVPVICDQYCWQLDWLSIRPTQMTWKLSDFPESLIREMFRVFREQTSERLFKVFPELKVGNLSEDFWSPGYFVDVEGDS